MASHTRASVGKSLPRFKFLAPPRCEKRLTACRGLVKVPRASALRARAGPCMSSSDKPREDEQAAVRRAKLAELRRGGWHYPNDFRRTALCAEVVAEFGALEADQITARNSTFQLAGRVVALRNFGKTVFLTLQDGSGRLQLYARMAELPEATRELVGSLDVGDTIGAVWSLFLTP